MIPYALLATALTILTSSATVGLAITVGYHIAEQIVVPILTVFVDGFDKIAGFTLGISAHALISEEGAQDFIFLVTTLGDGELPNTVQAFLVLPRVHTPVWRRRPVAVPAAGHHWGQGHLGTGA